MVYPRSIDSTNGSPLWADTRGVPVASLAIHADVASPFCAIFRQLNIPLGTELYYTKNGQKLQDELAAEGWLLEKPRVFDHPGFGV